MGVRDRGDADKDLNSDWLPEIDRVFVFGNDKVFVNEKVVVMDGLRNESVC